MPKTKKNIQSVTNQNELVSQASQPQQLEESVIQLGKPHKKKSKKPTINTITQLNHVPFPERKIIFSIDPGRVNFACRLEERKDDGTIEGLMFIRARFEELSEIIDFFEKNHELLKQTTICIVEKQMSINYTMIRVAQHVETYFLTKYPHVAVFEISSKLKVEKEVTIPTAKDILLKGKDTKSYEMLEKLGNPIKEKGKRKPKKEKLDDLCDTICQIEAFLDEMKRLDYKVQQGYLLKTKSTKGK
jgi:hypothetical protein